MYADDVALIAESESDLQKMLKICEHSRINILQWRSNKYECCFDQAGARTPIFHNNHNTKDAVCHSKYRSECTS
jgi:hypothetical protein